MSYLNFLSDYAQFYLLIHTIVTLVLLYMSKKDLLKHFVNIRKKIWVVLFIILIFGFYLRMAPGMILQRSNEQEWEYKDVAKRLYEGKELSYLVHGLGYPFLLSLLFEVFGASNSVVFYFVIALSSLTIMLVFLLSYALFKKDIVSVFAALVFALLPRHVYYSRTAENEPVLLFFITLTLLVFWITLNSGRIKLYLLSAMLLAFAVIVKLESAYMFIVLIIGMILFKQKAGFKRIAGVLLILLLFSPVAIAPATKNLAILSTACRIIPTIHCPSSYVPLGSNLSANLSGYKEAVFNNKDHKYYFFMFIITALFYFRRHYKQLIFLGSFVMLNLITYLVSPQPLGNRYIILVYPLYAILVGLGIFHIINLLTKIVSNVVNIEQKVINMAFVILLIVIIPITLYPLKELIFPSIEPEERLSDVYEILALKNKLDKKIPVVCCNWMNPCGFLLQDRNVYNLMEIGETERLKSANKVYYIESENEKLVGCNYMYKKDFSESYKFRLLTKGRFTKVYGCVKLA